jgi:ParB family chromosome partitioning protein
LNTRDVDSHPETITKIAASIRLHGQLQPCTVVTREAFLEIFAEHATAVGHAPFVQVTGGRRRAALLELGYPTIDMTVKNAVAESRAKFISATAAENIDREDYDLIEEARAVQLLVQECGSGKAAAEQLSRTPPWVTQRLNLLKLEAEVHMALRAAEIPLREVRDLHKRSREEQLVALKTWRKVAESRQKADESRHSGQEDSDSSSGNGSGIDPNVKHVMPRRSPVAAAIHRLGGTPVKIAENLRSALSAEDQRALAEELMREE